MTTAPMMPDCKPTVNAVGIGSSVLLGHGVGRRKIGRYWHECRDGDDGAREIYDRHYSRYHYADGRKPKLFVGPGEKCVLITQAGDAVWCWRKFKDASGQRGINNAIFRNEGGILSSLLILDAEEIAWGAMAGRTALHLRQANGHPQHESGRVLQKSGMASLRHHEMEQTRDTGEVP